jgi:proteasome lid subunit RPN8/RPN11
MFGPDVDAAIKAHAIACHPQESCGLVLGSGYLPCQNTAADPVLDFRIDAKVWLDNEPVLAVVHSHVNDKYHPTLSDMQGQIDTGVPWGLTMTDGTDAATVIWWGPGVEIPPLEERPFRHGPSGSDGCGDCYALIKDYHALRGIMLPEQPRDDGWWKETPDIDLYMTHFDEAGFIEIEDPEPHCVFLLKIRSQVYNHGGVITEDFLALHHLAWRMSAKQPFGNWINHGPKFLRYVGPEVTANIRKEKKRA